VVGSVALVELGILTSLGSGLVALVAAAVLVFAVLQFVGLRQIPRGGVTPGSAIQAR
jgi:hypothetical protein